MISNRLYRLWTKSFTAKKRIHYGIKGVCEAVYEQMGFYTIMQSANKDE